MIQIFNNLLFITFIYLTCFARWILSDNSSRIQSNSGTQTGIGTDVPKNIISTGVIKVRIFKKYVL